MNALRQWYEGLAPRERVAVIAGTVAVVLALFYYALWQPLNTSVADARVRVNAEAEQARWMLGVRDEARLLQSSGKNNSVKGRNESLLSIVDASSRENGLGQAVRRIQPDNNDQATVTLEKANFNQMLFWLRSLQRDYGIAASQMTVTRDEENGTVQARLTLTRGGA
ncbi:type II secretion system protein GspM [Salinisphaera aquimarina]|uniref:Type II secretion system protein M n=1 Tax=Salinisphaera aquimarina TaxID=2094031 RepID=A0ABV7ET44_9GAMM